MVKIGIEIKQGLSTPDGKSTLDIKLLDPSKKQLEEATENEKFIAQRIKNLLDEKLMLFLNDEVKEELF